MDLFHEKLSDYLSSYLTESRLERISEVIDLRTRYLTVVLEDVYKGQNASAVVRTSECLGIQDLHIIENLHKYNVDRGVVMGSSKWINIHKYANTNVCYKELKTLGYRLVGMAPRKDAKPLSELNLNSPTAFIFGTEYAGLSEFALTDCDEAVRLPIYGFTRSYNLSVSVAIALHFAVREIREKGFKWQLTKQEKQTLRLEFIRKTVKKSRDLEEEFRNRFGSAE